MRQLSTVLSPPPIVSNHLLTFVPSRGFENELFFFLLLFESGNVDSSTSGYGVTSSFRWHVISPSTNRV
jgi:hypothetical protein